MGDPARKDFTATFLLIQRLLYLISSVSPPLVDYYTSICLAPSLSDPYRQPG